jgi:hypothetical protein
LAEHTDSSTNRRIEIQVTPAGGTIDVPLVGSDPAPSDGDGRPAVNWRRAIGIAVVAGFAIGIVASVIRLATDDEDKSADSTVPVDELAAEITTPPTLTPVDTLPPADLDDGESTVAPALSDVQRPVYDAASGPRDLERVDIVTAVGQLGRDIARRSETHVELGNGGFVLDVTIERDPIRNRYQIVIESRDSTQVAIVDIPTGTTYVNPGTDNREEVLNADIIAGSGADDANVYFDRLLLGPLRPDTFDAEATAGLGVVSIDGIGLAREFVTTVPGSSIPEWQLYAFGPVFEFRAEDRPAELEYAAYVTENAQLAAVEGVAMIGDIPQLVQHRLTVLDESTIDVPDAPDVPDVPDVTSATSVP